MQNDLLAWGAGAVEEEAALAASAVDAIDGPFVVGEMQVEDEATGGTQVLDGAYGLDKASEAIVDIDDGTIAAAASASIVSLQEQERLPLPLVVSQGLAVLLLGAEDVHREFSTISPTISVRSKAYGTQ